MVNLLVIFGVDGCIICVMFVGVVLCYVVCELGCKFDVDVCGFDIVLVVDIVVLVIVDVVVWVGFLFDVVVCYVNLCMFEVMFDEVLVDVWVVLVCMMYNVLFVLKVGM